MKLSWSTVSGLMVAAAIANPIPDDETDKLEAKGAFAPLCGVESSSLTPYPGYTLSHAGAFKPWDANHEEEWQRSFCTRVFDRVGHDPPIFSWSTTFSYEGNNERVAGRSALISYHIPEGTDRGIKVPLWDISAIPARWKWDFVKRTKTKLIANVFFALYAETPEDFAENFRIQVWLGDISNPQARTYRTNAEGAPLKFEVVTIGDKEYKFYRYKVRANLINFNFIPSQNDHDFRGDLRIFLEWLSTLGHIPLGSTITGILAMAEIYSGKDIEFISRDFSARIV